MNTLFKNIKLLYGSTDQNIILDSNFNILSSNLLLNPDFIGDELITNGDFSNGSTDWILGTGWSVGDDKAISIATGGGQGVVQSVNGQVFSGKTYKVEYTILDYVSGNVRPSFTGGSSATGVTTDANGTYVQYLTLLANNTSFNIKATGTNGGFNGSITNISVKQVGEHWTTFTGSTHGVVLSSSSARIYSTDGTNVILQQQNVLITGKTYLFKYDVLEQIEGNLSVNTSFVGSHNFQYSLGSHQIVGTAQNSFFQINRISIVDKTIGNLSLHQLYANWNTTGDFNIDSSNLGSITCTGTGSLIQNDILEINQQYQITINYQNSSFVFSPFYVESKNNTTFNASPYTDKLVFEFTASQSYLQLNGNFQGLITKITAIKI